MAAVDVERLEEQVLSLSLKDREQILRALINSVGPPGEEVSGEEWDKAWEQELARRTEEIDSGKVELVSWEEVKKSLRREFPHAPEHPSRRSR